MKILQLCGYYPPLGGGIEIYVKELSEHLVKLGHEVNVITRYLLGRKPNNKIETINGVRIHWLTGKSFSRKDVLFAWINAYFKAQKIQPEIIHAHTVIPINTVASVLAIQKKTKLITTVHESQFLKGMKHNSYRTIARLSLRRSNLIYAASDQIRDEVKRLGFKDTISINNAVNTQRFKPKKDDVIRKELGLSKHTKIILSVRRMVEKNGPTYLFKALPYLLKKRKDFFLYFIGDGPEEKKIRNIIKKHSLEKYCFLKGSVNNNLIPTYLNSADVFVLPSLMEATSIAGLEAMACQLTLVGTNVGGIPQIIDDKKTGYLCKPANPIDLAEKLNLAIDNKHLGKTARKKVLKEFSWQQRTKEILELYDEA